MTLKSLLQEYTDLIQTIGQDKLDRLEELGIEVKTAARELSDEEVGKVKTDLFKITISRPFKKYYDFKLLKKYATKAEYEVIEDKALKVEVDKLTFEELVKSGLVSKTLKQKSFK